MKFVFLSAQGSKSGINDHIIAFIEKEGHKVFNGTLPHKATDVELKKHISQLTAEIKKAEGLIVEASTPSFDLGRFVTLGLQQHKPTLLLYTKELAKSFLFGGNRLITSCEYKANKEDTVQSALKDFFKMTKKKRLTYRFNLMISKDLNSYLMDKARYSGMSKADYIRNLILQDMDQIEE